VFLLAVREELYRNHIPLRRPVFDGLLHGWPLILVNVSFYGYLCWLAFVFIRGSRGVERAFVAGWFINILLWPFKMTSCEWALAAKHIGTFALFVSLLASLTLLLRQAGDPEPNEETRT
jgi:hypothetical protein